MIADLEDRKELVESLLFAGSWFSHNDSTIISVLSSFKSVMCSPPSFLDFCLDRCSLIEVLHICCLKPTNGANNLTVLVVL